MLEPTSGAEDARSGDERGCTAYRRLMELVCSGFSWEDAALLADAPVPLACITRVFAPAA